MKRYVGVDIHHNPGQLYALIFALLAVAGLVTSLYVNRRRVWVRTGTHPDGRTMVEYGLLARGEDHRLAGEAQAIRGLLADEWGLDSQNAPEPGTAGGYWPGGQRPGRQRITDSGRAGGAARPPRKRPQKTSSSQQPAHPSQRRTQ